MTIELLAQDLNVSADKLSAVLQDLSITIEDVAADSEIYLPEIKKKLGLGGGLAVTNANPAPASGLTTQPTSTATKAKKGKVTKAEKLTAAKQKAQAAQTSVNSTLDAATLALIEDARSLVKGSEEITDEIAAYVASQIDGMPESLATKVVAHLQESGGASKVGFSGISSIAEKHLEAIR